MSSRFWVGGTGTWDASDTTHWASSSGGTGGQSVPVAGDDVTIDASSGAGTITVATDFSIKSLSCGAMGMTLDFSANNNSPTLTGAITTSGTGTRTINWGSGTFTLSGNNFTIFSNGTTTGQTMTGSATFNFTYSGGTGTRSFQFGGTGAGTISTTTCTFNIMAGTDTVSFSGTNIGIPSLSFASFSGTWSSTSTSIAFAKDLTMSAAMTNSVTATLQWTVASSAGIITSNGKSFGSAMIVNTTSGTVTLADALVTTSSLTLTAGTFNANGYNVTCGSFSSSNANVRTLTMGTGTWTLTGTGTVWNTGTTTNLTASQASSSIVISDASASAKTFTAGGSGGAETFGNVTVSPGGSGAVKFNNSTTRTYASFNATGPKSIVLTASSAYSTPILNVTGSAGNLVTFTSTIPGTQYSFSVASGDVYARYVSLQDSNATGGARFFALNSTNVSNNTGWNFRASRTAASGRFNIRDQHAAISLDGSTSFLVKASPTGINNGTNGSVTISAWVRLDQTDLCTVAELHVNGGTSPSFGIGQSGGQYVVFSDRVNGGNNKVIAKATFDTYIGLNRWVMLTYVLTSADITIYAGTTAILPTSSFGTAINAGTISNLFIGKGQTVGQADIQFLKGGVKDVRIYNAALTATEVSNLYYSQIDSTTPSAAWEMDEGAGSSIVTSVGSNNLTATGITWTSNRPFAARKRDDGNLVKNGDFEYAPPFVAATNTTLRTIDGTAGGSLTNFLFGGYTVASIGGTANAQFDSSTAYRGNSSMKLSTLDSAGTIVVTSFKNNPPTTPSELISVLPNTQYRFDIYAKTNNAATNSVFADVREFSFSFTTVATTSTNKLSGTNDWTLLTVTFTTGATTAYVGFIMRENVAGNVSTANFDLASLAATTPQVRAAASGRVAIS